jgi:tetratricopeptide (TPR) repeat protein
MSDKQAAIADFSTAIQLAPNYAEAYRDRGILYLELGNKREAVKDLREAAKYFLEKGDIPNYEAAKELSKQAYEISLPTATNGIQPAMVDSLFA